MSAGSKKVVLIAICGNAALTVLKFTVAVPTHSAAMMNEAIHSLMEWSEKIPLELVECDWSFLNRLWAGAFARLACLAGEP